MIDGPDALLSAVACAGVAQCTAVGAAGDEVTFDPVSAASSARAMVDRDRAGGGLLAVECPSISQCTVLDGAGNEVTFNPASPGKATIVAIDAGDELSSLACPAASLCVAVDRNGKELEGDPATGRQWTSRPIAGANALQGVSCPSLWQCTAVDNAGGVFVGAQRLAAPDLTGVHQAHSAWRESPGSGKQHGHVPVGTVFSFVLSQQAAVKLEITASMPGRTAGDGCVPPTRRNRTSRRCTRLIVVGALLESGRQGPNRVVFGGRLPGARVLDPGRYTILITAANAACERSQQRSLTFTIIG